MSRPGTVTSGTGYIVAMLAGVVTARAGIQWRLGVALLVAGLSLTGLLLAVVGYCSSAARCWGWADC